MTAETLAPGTWQRFTAAPHRIMFLAGTIQALLTLTWWLADLSGRYAGWYLPPQWPLPPNWIHAFLMIYGFFPFFVFGFLMTAMPSWMGRERVPRELYVPAWLLMVPGMVLFYIALFAGKALMLVAIAVHAAGWAIATYALARLIWTGPMQDLRHALVVVVSLAVGWLGIVAYGIGISGEADYLVEVSKVAGVWFFLVPVLLAVSHRMIPFFTSRAIPGVQVYRPYWALWVLLGCTAGHGMLELLDARRLMWMFELPAAAVALYLTVRWQFHRSFQVRLVAVLHLAFVWVAIGFVLFAARSLVEFATGGEVKILGLAPLHALTVGYFSAMVIGMASRVTLGHSGRELLADNLTWYSFLGLWGAAALRVLAEFPGVSPAAFTYMTILSAFVWVACISVWALYYAPIFWRPRADGKGG